MQILERCSLQAASFYVMLSVSKEDSFFPVQAKNKRKDIEYKMKSKNSRNYMDYIPEKNPDIEYETDEKGIVTVYIEWKGFYNRIAQRFFRRPRVSDIKMDDYGSFVWQSIDGNKNVYLISQELDRQFPGMEKSLSRLIKFLEILHDNRLIFWKGEKKKS